ncbi:SDR family oxidoreductase [Providencia vermicola]|uniref:SDR family oxidoreductase n=1 Tax=Providencia vermicola TaxID=333965 RepID=A0AAX3RZQ9_9GAMM|nr:MULTISPECIES: SDR family oxidoreductase [Providencia]ELX8380192.1 SDR family oxidoreductase [Providencia stuartii]EMD5259729.1 SDR family oxidoreductase [Providencia stuartii]USB36835.1 SDR family oxidoreductase [Providencia vermicola]WFC05766.1 SDR family oxidoreductase [Providencia vermicola]
MKKVAIVGLGWLGLPLARALLAAGMDVSGTKTTPDGIAAARAIGIDCYYLQLTPELDCDPTDFAQLMEEAGALIILLPPSKINVSAYVETIELLVDTAITFRIPRVIFTSSTSVYGDLSGEVNEESERQATTASAQALIDVENWLHALPNISVDILRLAGLVGEKRHAGRFLAGKKSLKGAQQPVNIVHQDDVIEAIKLLLKQPQGGHIYNLCAPEHPQRADFYRQASQSLNLELPEFMLETEATTGKIVNGNRICQELGFEYQYPNPMNMPMTI